jgi:hypothetical protein
MGKLLIVLGSLLIIGIVSTIGALPALFWGLSLSNYLAVFCILTVLQLVIGKLWNYSVDQKTFREMERVDSANAMAEAIQYLPTTCAYCGTANLTKILLDRDNTFNCEGCDEKNSVIIHSSTARITMPIMPKQEAAEIFKSLDGDING